jgi:LysR family transcriptional activator of nhaA
MKQNDSAPVRLNYHHLEYFWQVARDGNLTRTARRLRVAQSALSSQIRALEAQLGEDLFARVGRGLALTEAGRVAFAQAEIIFTTGRELIATFEGGCRPETPLRVGAVATLSRNFQRSFVRPLLARAETPLHLSAGSHAELLARLELHALDVVLSNQPADPGTPFRTRRLARQPASVVSSSPMPHFAFPGDLLARPLILPGPASGLRVEFEALCERAGVRPRVLAEVDDMATLRLLARDTSAFVLVPSVVVVDELREGRLHELCVVPGVAESFHAITVARRFEHPLLKPLLDRDEAELLGTPRALATR